MEITLPVMLIWSAAVMLISIGGAWGTVKFGIKANANEIEKIWKTLEKDEERRLARDQSIDTALKSISDTLIKMCALQEAKKELREELARSKDNGAK